MKIKELNLHQNPERKTIEFWGLRQEKLGEIINSSNFNIVIIIFQCSYAHQLCYMFHK